MIVIFGILICLIILEKKDLIMEKEYKNVEFFVWVVIFVIFLFMRWIEIYFFVCRKFIEYKKDRWISDKGYVILYMCFSFLRIILLIVFFLILYCFEIWGINEIYNVFIFMFFINVLGFLFWNCIEILKLIFNDINMNLSSIDF